MTQIKSNQAATIAGKHGSSLITDDKFYEIYAALLQCRMLDERLGKTAGFERWPGREAGTAGIVACLNSGDSVAPTPRSILAAYLHDRRVALPRESASPATSLAAATGEALRHKLEKKGKVSVAFASAQDPEPMREIFAAASREALPVLYALQGGVLPGKVCGNIPVIRVDGSDTVAVYRVAHEAILRAREGGGPTILEYAEWPMDTSSQDPLAKLEHYLSGRNLFRQSRKWELEKKYAKAIDTAVEAAALWNGCTP